MIEVGDLVRVIDGGYNGYIGLVMIMPYDNVAKLKILNRSIHGYRTYNTVELEKL